MTLALCCRFYFLNGKDEHTEWFKMSSSWGGQIFFSPLYFSHRQWPFATRNAHTATHKHCIADWMAELRNEDESWNTTTSQNIIQQWCERLFLDRNSLFHIQKCDTVEDSRDIIDHSDLKLIDLNKFQVNWRKMTNLKF